MSFDGVKNNKINGGLDKRTPNDDGITILFTGGPEVGTTFKRGESYPLITADMADDLGVNASYDSTNSELLRYDIEEFFRLAPDSTLIIAPVDYSALDADGLWLTKIVKENPTAKWIGITGKGVDFTAPAFTTFIQTVQGYVNDLRAEHLYIDGVIHEGVGPAVAVPVTAFPDLTTLNAENAGVFIGQDPIVDAIIDGTKRASMGAVLGMRAVRMVNESIGSVDIKKKPDGKKGIDNYPLTDTTVGAWLTAQLTDGKKITELSLPEQKELTKRGYIFAGLYFGYGGIYISEGPTCVTVTSDYSELRNNAVWNKAARILRAKLMPRIKSTLRIDAATGDLRVSTVKALEAIGEDAIAKTMLADEECGGFNILIDPKQKPDRNTPLKMKSEVLHDRILHTLEIDLGLTYQLKLS